MFEMKGYEIQHDIINLTNKHLQYLPVTAGQEGVYLEKRFIYGPTSVGLFCFRSLIPSYCSLSHLLHRIGTGNHWGGIEMGFRDKEGNKKTKTWINRIVVLRC